jgi:hypothetical protein
MYDCSDGWLPIDDKSEPPGFYLAVGAGGNQYKTLPRPGAVFTPFSKLAGISQHPAL